MADSLELALRALAEHSEPNIESGVSDDAISGAEAELGISFPEEYAEYLRRFNYAELYGDPIFGIHEDPGFSWCDVVRMNSNSHLSPPGYLAFFNSDLDGTCFIKLASNEVFLPDFAAPVAKSFSRFILQLLDAG